MTIAYWCMLVGGLLPFLFTYIGKFTGSERFDNRNPRAWFARQSGLQARANAAQLNSFETLPLFLGGVLVAHSLTAPQVWIDSLAVGYVTARLGYGTMYCIDRPTLRSGFWIVATGCIIGLFIVAAL